MVQAAVEDLAQRLHRRVGLLGQVVGEVELELVADHAALAQQVVEPRHRHLDQFRALRLHRVQALADDAADLVVLRRGTEQRPQHADPRPP